MAQTAVSSQVSFVDGLSSGLRWLTRTGRASDTLNTSMPNVDFANDFASQKAIDGDSQAPPRQLVVLQLTPSPSFPNLLHHLPRTQMPLRRTKSFSDLVSAANGNNVGCNEEQPTSCDDSHAMSAKSHVTPPAFAVAESLHLYSMDISKQLRSISSMSDELDDDNDVLSSIHPWSFHRRKRSDFRSERSSHSPYAERMRSPAAASSLYSQPSMTYQDLACPVSEPCEGVHNPLVSYRLLNVVPRAPSRQGLDGAGDSNLGETNNNDVIPAATPPIEHQGSPSDSPGTTVKNDNQSIKWLSTRSLPCRNSTSNLTNCSKRSRFMECFTPPQKRVRKRRSIFRFFHPGSRKQHQSRNISTPIISRGMHQNLDGPIDDAAFLPAQCESGAHSHQAGTRSANLSSFEASGRRGTVWSANPGQTDTVSHLAIPGAVPSRRSSLADYERSLTAIGDDRRRPSTVNLTKLKEVQEDDHHHTHAISRRLSRATGHNEESTGLMAQALEKHQQEKAMFRSPSKRRESVCASLQPVPPDFLTDPLMSGGKGPSDSPLLHVDEHRNSLDTVSTDHGRRFSNFLRHKPSAGSSSALRTANCSAFRPDVFDSPTRATKMGTNLDSWSRFPSHTRAERCGSAGSLDAVVTRDFAVETTIDGNNRKWGKQLRKSGSSYFGGLVRYYSNVFSSSGSSTARNRRSSTAASGWLASPDLELLPPPTSHEPALQHHDHHFRQHLRELEREVEEAVRRDVQYLGEEAVRLEHRVVEDVQWAGKQVSQTFVSE